MVLGSEVPQGQEVKWYAGGLQAAEEITVAAQDVTNGYIDLTKNAEFGSVMITVGGIVKGCSEFQATSTDPATEASGTKALTYTGIAENDVVAAYYLDIETTPLTQVATCQDVKTGISADEKSAAVHGQANKLKTVGAIEQEAELEELHYNQTFVAMNIGDQVTDSPAAGNSKLSTKYNGFKKIGGLVGKRSDSTGAIIYKWFLFGAQATGLDKEFPTEDFYNDSVKFAVDDYLEVALS